MGRQGGGGGRQGEGRCLMRAEDCQGNFISDVCAKPQSGHACASRAHTVYIVFFFWFECNKASRFREC
jgi:hypothetical protein